VLDDISLEGIAEIAIALAGFAGLIAMVRSGPLHEWHPRAQLAFWVTLGWSIAAVVFALLPSLLLPIGVASWFFLNLLLGLCLLIGLVVMLRAHFGLTRRGDPTQNPWHWVVIVSILGCGSIGVLGAVAGLFGTANDAWYRFGVITCLMAAFPSFVASFRYHSNAPAALQRDPPDGQQRNPIEVW
jgi:hypothetical protein